METWKSVAGWEGYYEVSDAGSVRSLNRTCTVINRFGREEQRSHRGKLLKATVGKSGYAMVSFTRPGGVRVYAYVHRLVAEAFLGPAPLGAEVCHNDGVRHRNTLRNLRYDTRSANALDRHAHGTMNQAHGEAHYFRKLSEDDVRLVRKTGGRVSQREMGRRLGVSHSTIGNALRGDSWRRVR